MILEGGVVIDDQFACLSLQCVQHAVYGHPSSYKSRPTEFRRINVNSVVFFWTSRTASTIINDYSSWTPRKLKISHFCLWYCDR